MDSVSITYNRDITGMNRLRLRMKMMSCESTDCKA